MTSRNILVINCGSSSIKFALLDPAHSHFALSGLAERLGSPDAVLHWQQDGQKHSLSLPGADHRGALAQLLPLAEQAAASTMLFQPDQPDEVLPGWDLCHALAPVEGNTANMFLWEEVQWAYYWLAKAKFLGPTLIICRN